MEKLILRAYDFFSARKWAAALLLVILMGLCAFSASRISYQEDISDFLPKDRMSEAYSSIYQKLGAEDKIAVFFQSKEGDTDPSRISEAMDAFGINLEEADKDRIITDLQVTVDGSSFMDVINFIGSNWPYFLVRQDYSRIDSLLAVPDYVRQRLTEDKQSLYSPASSVTAACLRTDPLGFYTPVLSRLEDLKPSEDTRIEDGHIFTEDGKTGIIFFSSPFGESESGRNSEIVSLLHEARKLTEAEFPIISIFSTGSPVVAVENAAQIKRDSALAVAIALILIGIVLFLSYKRLADVFWIAVSILCGFTFALGIISLFRTSVSIIILGIGSMIIGIAVNYPLHFVDHLKYQPDKRKALKEIATPLIVGNITTVGAFLSLVLLKSRAMRDFGIIGSAMMVGTILFALFFLPLFISSAKGPRNTVKLDLDRHLSFPARFRKAFFVIFLVVTTAFLFLGRSIKFDSDLHNINYMTEKQSEGFDILSSMSGENGGSGRLYAVCQNEDAEKAVSANAGLVSMLRKVVGDDGGKITTIADFLPSETEQTERLALWNDFWQRHTDLPDAVRAASKDIGFTENAFDPFYSAPFDDFPVRKASYFDPITAVVGQATLIRDTAGTTIINYVQTPASDTGQLKERIRKEIPEDCLCFDNDDLGGRLVSLLSQDFDSIGLVCSLIVFIFLWLSFGRLELTLVSFLPLAVGWIWIIGIMQLFDIRFNIVNIILATFIFGQGDDYTIFITEGLMNEYASGKKTLLSFKNCITLSAVIMFIGIGVLIFARHPAMRSLAQVTMIGMLCVVFMAYYLPPLIFKWMTTEKGKIRKVPVTIGRILRTVAVLVIYITSIAVLTLFALPYFAFVPKSERRTEFYHRVLRKTAYLAIKIIPGTRLSVANPNKEDFAKPSVIICNHQSHFDILAIMALSPKIILMTNDWVWKNPLYGFLIRKAEFLPITDGTDKNLPKLLSLIERGYSIAIFPEGTRSEDCHIQRFHRGAFKLAKDLNVDLLPAFIHGFGYLLPKKESLLRKADLHLEICSRISPDKIPDDIREFTKEMRRSYINHYAQIRRDIEKAGYCADYVRYQYLYKGPEAWKECRNTLKASTFESVDSSFSNVKSVNVLHSGYGSYALLLALSNPDLQVASFEEDEEKCLTASHCAAVPDNLTIICGETDRAAAEKEVIL